MRKLLALSLSPLALGLAAYAGAADSPAAGQPLYVAALATTPVYARDTRHSGGKTVLVLANTGGQTVISVDLKAQPYFRGIPLKDVAGLRRDHRDPQRQGPHHPLGHGRWRGGLRAHHPD